MDHICRTNSHFHGRTWKIIPQESSPISDETRSFCYTIVFYSLPFPLLSPHRILNKERFNKTATISLTGVSAPSA